MATPEFEPVREGQLSEEKLKWGMWWVTNKTRVRRVFIIVLLIIDVMLVGFATFGFLDWYVFSGVREREEIARLTETDQAIIALREKLAPRHMQFEEPIVLSGIEGSIDIIARATNPNPMHIASFDYSFSFSGTITPSRAVVLPGESKWLYALRVPALNRGENPVLQTEKLSWQRISSRQTPPDYTTWSKRRLDFSFEDVIFTPAFSGDNISTSYASFILVNNTAFHYTRVPLLIVLWSGSRIVSVNTVSVSDVRPGERRNVGSSWFHSLPNVTRVEIIPDVNIFDDRLFL